MARLLRSAESRRRSASGPKLRQRARQRVEGDRLGEDTGDAGWEAFAVLDAAGVAGQDQHRRAGDAPCDLGGDLFATAVAKVEVGEDDVEGAAGEGLEAGTGARDGADAMAEVLHHHFQELADDRLVL